MEVLHNGTVLQAIISTSEVFFFKSVYIESIRSEMESHKPCCILVFLLLTRAHVVHSFDDLILGYC